MGTKFAHFSIRGSSEAEATELLRRLPLKTSSLFDRLNKMNPGMADKLEQAFIDFSKIQPDDPRAAKIGDQAQEAKKALEFLHSVGTVYYIGQNNEWTTVCSEEFGFESIDYIALAVSKITPKLIMSIADFDDDVFILSLLKNGKTITRHASGGVDVYDIEETLGDIAAMSDALRIKGKERELALIFKDNDIWKKFENLEKLLNMRLWLPRGALTQNTEDSLNLKKVTIG